MTGARLARVEAGLDTASAARLAGFSVGYLREVERGANCSHRLARRLARLYSVPIVTFARRRTRTAETDTMWTRRAGQRLGATKGQHGRT